MNCLALAWSEYVGGMMLVGAAVAFYVASRAAADALSQRNGAAVSATRHALAQWVGIGCVCAVAVWLDHGEIAVGVIFSTAVAALSLHLGVAIASSPQVRAQRSGHGFDILVDEHRVAADESDAPVPIATPATVRGSRAWAMVLPAGVLALMAGFSGKLTLVHALLFAVQGLLVMMVWDAGRSGSSPAERAKPLSTGRRAQLALASALALIGAMLAVYGAVRMSDETGIMSTGLIAAAAIGPLLVLPMIGSASLLAAQGQMQTVIGASVAIVLLNLCCLLPLVIVGWHARQHYVPSPAATGQAVAAPATTQSVADDPSGEVEPTVEEETEPVLSFPIAVWRIDAVLLILLGLMLLPVSLNLWEMRRLEGILLIVIYGGYLMGTTFLGRRW